MKSDLISREWVLKEIRAHKAHAQSFRQVTYATGYMCGLSVLEGRLAEAPAVDAAPVVHGRWIKHCDCVECSACGYVCWADSAPTYDYCPNCNAKMDLEGDT